jgi:hypothetical protein
MAQLFLPLGMMPWSGFIAFNKCVLAGKRERFVPSQNPELCLKWLGGLSLSR